MMETTLVYSIFNGTTEPDYTDQNCAEYFTYYSVRQVTMFVLQPIIYAFGMPGNTVALIVWLLPHMRRSNSGYYFSSLAIADECVLICHLIFNFQSAYGVSGLLKNDGACKFLNITFITAQCCSTFIGLAMTVERFFAVKFPLQLHKLFEKAKLLKMILITFGSSLTMGLLIGLLWNYRFDVETSTCVVLGTSRRDSGSPVLGAVTIILIVFGIICPICAILGLNIVIIHGLVKMKRDRLENLQCLPRSAVSKQEKETNKTIMILCVGLYMVIARAPDNIVYLLQPFFPPGSPNLSCEQRTESNTWIRYYRYISAGAVIETFALTSYAFNILIYSLAGRKFRKTIRTYTYKTLHKCKIAKEPEEEWTASEMTPMKRDERERETGVNNKKTMTSNLSTIRKSIQKIQADTIELEDMDRNGNGVGETSV